jgi:flagellin-specific chaperone FliS
MKIEITKQEANVIQVAIDHLYDEHTDVLADALCTADNEQVRESYHILRMIEEIHAEILHQLSSESTK